MRIQDDDAATLRAWAAEDRRDLIIGTAIAPLLPFAWWWLVVDWNEENLCLDTIVGFVIAFATFYSFVGLSELAPGPGAPRHILAGAESSVTCAAVVHRDDGDRPYPMSIAVDMPNPDDRYRYVHMQECMGLVAGDRLTAYGWGSIQRPFKKGMLLVADDGRRLWTRECLTVSEIYVSDAPS